MKHQKLRLLTSASVLSLVALAAACGSDKDGSNVDIGNGGSNGNGGAQNSAATGNIIIMPMGGEGSGDMPPEGGASNCGFTNLTATPPIVNVLLVVDKSGSMAENKIGDETRWAVLTGALETTLEQVGSKLSLGLDFYPYSGKSGQALSDACEMPSTEEDVVVPVQDGTTAVPLILDAFNEEPAGGTPTAAALARALAYYTTGDGKSLEGEKYVLLATDGGPNCSADMNMECEAATCTVNMDGLCPVNGLNCCDPKNDPDGPTKCLDDAATVDAVKALADKSIKTFVVGIPGTEAYADTLDAVAEQSGVENPDAPPSYFAVSVDAGAAGLESVLGAITTGLIRSCELRLEEEPPNIKDVYVVIDGELIKQGDADGWAPSDPVTSPPTIMLQGATCEKLETEGAEYINVSYGCPNFDPH